MTVILVLVTIGFYLLVWVHKAAREATAHSRGVCKAHPRVRRAWVWGAMGVVLFVAAMGAAPENPEEEFSDLGAVLLLLAMASGLAALAYWYGAWWAIWDHVAMEERGLGHKPLRPALMLAMLLVPYVNVFGAFYVPYRTQRGLNTLWAHWRG